MVEFFKFYFSFRIFSVRRNFYLTKVWSYFIPFVQKNGFELKNWSKIINFHKFEIFTKWILLTEDHFYLHKIGLYDSILQQLNSWEVFWLFQRHFEKVIFENPKICESPYGKVVCRALSLYRRDLNYLPVTREGFKFCVDVKKLF